MSWTKQDGKQVEMSMRSSVMDKTRWKASGNVHEKRFMDKIRWKASGNVHEKRVMDKTRWKASGNVHEKQCHGQNKGNRNQKCL